MTQTNSNFKHSNFSFLQEHNPIFFQLAHGAELAFTSDPNTTLVKLRQLGEAIAQEVAINCGIMFDSLTSQVDLIYKISHELSVDKEIITLFHTLRKEGNKAVHQFKTLHRDAIDGLRLAHSLSIWFHQSFGKESEKFSPLPFSIPSDPSSSLTELQAEIAKLRSELEERKEDAASNKQLANLLLKEKKEFESVKKQMEKDKKELIDDSSIVQQQKAFEERITKLQEELKKKDDAIIAAFKKQRKKVKQHVTLSEELTRIIIDQQLRDAGWEVNSTALTWKNGTRPVKNKNLAISEWPTQFNGQAGRADYVLFAGLTPIGIVEAKKKNKNVSGALTQAERYAKGLQITAPLKHACWIEGSSDLWKDHTGAAYNVPFIYSCNGRPYIKQCAELSGTWFRDVRKQSNTSHSLQSFHSPDGLIDKLKRSKEKAEQALKQEGFSYLKLRDYQEKAIQKVEEALENGQKECLLAMATGTGKTRTIMGLMYRMLKTERFNRILFLVDRNALGKQALDVFAEVPIEQNLSLSKTYNIASLGDMAVEAETRVQVATVQAMVQRIFASDTSPSIDQYDCIIVDEAHRGYTLDQEMTDGELANRDAAQYLSAYRRVLEYFDAVKIGLTATPARHTTQIFGLPVYTYTYREAVAEDWLIDHEPPIRYTTVLSENNIHFEKGEKVEVVNTYSGDQELTTLEDELEFSVESFNRRVINEDFNRVICEELVKELVPDGREKTMIFCATDLHADSVKRLLDEAFKELYEDEYNEKAVQKITGKSDKVDDLIKQFKNEKYPSIAITVDLLTTGIDVPSVCNLVFMRRVKSRILYEQMLGRATRRCDEIGKTVFRIYDPVDIYAALQDVSTMKPLVKNPQITLEQLFEELTTPEKLEKALKTNGEKEETTHADDILKQLSQKIMRVLRKAASKADENENIKEKLKNLEQLWGVKPEKLHLYLQEIGPKETAAFLKKHHTLLNQLVDIKHAVGTDHFPIISEHEDELLERTQTFGENQKPEDYLDSFKDFITQNINQNAALAAVVNRPRDLTREQLKEVKLLLDQSKFPEASLDSAWRAKKNHEIAASIIGYIRQAAIGEALIPFEQRLQTAMDQIYTSHPWNQAQKRWLKRLQEQIKLEVVIDKNFVHNLAKRDGGFKKLDKIFDKKLESVLDQLKDLIWQAS